MVRFPRFSVVLAVISVVAASFSVPLPSSAAANDYVGSAFVTGRSGYWLVAPNGNVDNYDGAGDYGDMDDAHLNKPVVGMTATPSGNGYWLVASDGGIFSFGDAAFYGSTGSIKLNQPIVGMSATPTGRGYWLVASDGGIFAYGDARFFGSTGSLRLNRAIVGMSATPGGGGYWLVASDGGIFAFGDARFFGSTGGASLNQPVVGMATTPTGNGYWLVASDGGVFAYGDASFRGSGAGMISGGIVTFVPESTGGYVIVDGVGRVMKFPGGAGGASGTPAFSTIPVISPSPISSPAGDLNGWKYIFGDDFNTNAPEGSFLSTYRNWGAYNTGWQDTSKRGMYDTNVLSVSNGAMNIHLHTGADGKPRAAVPYPYINGTNVPDKTNQLYGRYEVRFRADQVQGYKTAFLLWPDSEAWPRDGEIDFPEGNLTGRIEAFMHRQGATSGGDQAAFSTTATYPGWHTAVTEWSPNAVRFILDGNVVGTATSRVPNTPMHWVLQTETNLDGAPIPASASGNVQIDYVRVWAYSPSTVAG